MGICRRWGPEATDRHAQGEGAIEQGARFYKRRRMTRRARAVLSCGRPGLHRHSPRARSQPAGAPNPSMRPASPACRTHACRQQPAGYGHACGTHETWPVGQSMPAAAGCCANACGTGVVTHPVRLGLSPSTGVAECAEWLGQEEGPSEVDGGRSQHSHPCWARKPTCAPCIHAGRMRMMPPLSSVSSSFLCAWLHLRSCRVLPEGAEARAALFCNPTSRHSRG